MHIINFEEIAYHQNEVLYIILAFAMNKKIQVFGLGFFWPARRDLNPRPSESESAAISSFATGG